MISGLAGERLDRDDAAGAGRVVRRLFDLPNSSAAHGRVNLMEITMDV